MTVRCPSNGRSASSTSGLVAPAAQSSAGRVACSCLSWPAVLLRRPHRPYYSHRWPGHPSTHPHPLLFCGDGSLTPQRTSEPSYSTTRGHPLPRLPRLRVIPFLGLVVVQTTALVLSVQRGQRPTSIGRVLYVERLTSGSTTAARKCLLFTRKIIIPPPHSRDPPYGPPYFTKKNSPLTVGSHQLSLRARKCLLITHKK